MTEVLAAIRRELEPKLQARVTAMPIVPDGAKWATININGIEGGQQGREEVFAGDRAGGEE